VCEGHTIQMTTILENMRVIEDELSSIQTLIRGPFSRFRFRSRTHSFSRVHAPIYRGG